MLKYTKECLEELIRKSTSVTDVLRLLNLRLNGGNHKHISSLIKKYEINTDHFSGSNHRKGKVSNNRKMCSEILVLNRLGRKEPVYRLRRAMLEYGFKYECCVCGIRDIWNGIKLLLEIDHINGNFLDNRCENLRFVCPNCHSQFPTSTSSIIC